jgi:hypothetical protein
MYVCILAAIYNCSFFFCWLKRKHMMELQKRAFILELDMVKTLPTLFIQTFFFSHSDILT